MKKYYLFFGEGSPVNQIICAVLINLPVFAYGNCIGWTSPMTLLLQSDQSPRGTPFTDIEISWIASVAFLTCMPFNYIVTCVGDCAGRKISVIIISSCLAGCWIIKLASVEAWALIVARALAGISMAGCWTVCPIYTKEISQDSIRGFLGSFVTLFYTTGMLFLYIIGDLLSYNAILWVCLAIPAVHIILFMMMPESPSYLLKHGQEEEAKRVIAWLRCRSEDDSIVQQEIDQIKKERDNDEESSKFALKAILQDKILFRAFRIAMFICISREICGAIPVLNFAGDIFKTASKGTSLTLTPNQQAMMLGAVQVTGSALASGIVEKAGRKPIIVLTAIILGLSMCTLATWFVLRSYGIVPPAWIPIVTLCVSIFCDSSGLLPLSVVITSEMFSFKYRGTVLAICMTTASCTAFLQMLFFKPVVNAMGAEAAFYFFGIACLLGGVYMLLVTPETKLRKVEEIYLTLMTKKEKAAVIEKVGE